MFRAKVNETSGIQMYGDEEEEEEVRTALISARDMPDEKQITEDEEDEDIISSAIGEYGRWQLRLTFLLSLVNIPCTWHIFSPTFHSLERDAWCARPPEFSHVDPHVWMNYTQPEGICSIVDIRGINASSVDEVLQILSARNDSERHLVKCQSWEFSGEGETLISEFGLLCDKKHLTKIAEMMFLAGVALGGIVCGILSDKYGRKRTLMFSILIQTILGTLIAFSPVFEMYYILRAILGFISVSVVFSGFVLSIELVGGPWRTIAGISYLFPVSVSYMIIALMAWFLRDWRQLQLAISLPGILFLALWWVLPESPRWLHALGRIQDVKAILQQAANANRRELPHNLEKQLLPVAAEVKDTFGILDLFRTTLMRKITLLLAVIWFAVYLVYYGIVLNVGNIGGDLYITSALSGLVEIPAVAISIVFLLKMGRRWPLSLTLLFAGVSCLCMLPIPYIYANGQWLKTTFAMTGKFLISSSNAVMPVFTAELYPTTMRNLGVGASNLSAGIALMLVPYLWELAVMHDTVPVIVVGACGLIGGICVLFLPETGNTPLKHTLTGEAEDRPKISSSSSTDAKRINAV